MPLDAATSVPFPPASTSNAYASCELVDSHGQPATARSNFAPWLLVLKWYAKVTVVGACVTVSVMLTHSPERSMVHPLACGNARSRFIDRSVAFVDASRSREPVLYAK